MKKFTVRYSLSIGYSRAIEAETPDEAEKEAREREREDLKQLGSEDLYDLRKDLLAGFTVVEIRETP